MDDLRSNSYRDERMQVGSCYGSLGYGGGGRGYGHSPNGLHDRRCYSASFVTSSRQGPPFTATQMPKVLKKVKSTNGSISKAWCFGDPEFQRKKRVASYKVYTVESKMKGSFRKSFRWIKDRYSQMVHGQW